MITSCPLESELIDEAPYCDMRAPNTARSVHVRMRATSRDACSESILRGNAVQLGLCRISFMREFLTFG